MRMGVFASSYLYTGMTELPAGVMMFTGTIAAQGGIAGSDQFSMALVDRTSRRTLWHSYDTAIVLMVARKSTV